MGQDEEGSPGTGRRALGSEKDEEAGRVCAGRGVVSWPDCRVAGVSRLCGALGVHVSMKHRPSPSA